MVKLQGTLGGMRKMKRLPGAIFIVDPHRERIGVTEANKLEIPVVGTGDTNVDPDELDYITPATDDAIRAIRLLCTLVADAALEGAQERASRAIEPEIELPEEPTYDDVEATDELVAALAGGAARVFAPDDDDDLLPGGPAPAAAPAEDGATPEEIAAELAREAAEKEADRDATPAGAPDQGTNTRTDSTTTPPGRSGPRTEEHMTTTMDISAEAVKQLREQTGAGFMDCKRALQETGGDVERAVVLLRERGIAAAAKKSDREVREGLISSYIHTGGRVGVLIEVNCETDFVARTERFQKLVRDLAIQVAGLDPMWVDVDAIPADALA